MFCHGSKTIKVKNNSGRWILSQEHFIGHVMPHQNITLTNTVILKQTARHNHALNKLLLLLLLLKYVISQLLPIKTLKFLSNASETTSSINSSVLTNLSSVKI